LSMFLFLGESNETVEQAIWILLVLANV
jgi:hypothetical protein